MWRLADGFSRSRQGIRRPPRELKIDKQDPSRKLDSNKRGYATMPTQLGDASDFLPIETAPNPTPDTRHQGHNEVDIEAKGESEHVELKNTDIPNFVYHDQEDPSKRTGLRKLMRRNPSLDFIKEVARANQEDLDMAEVKKVGGTS